jgi:GcrA cell cycle regulator
LASFWKTGAEGEAQIAQLKELVSENMSFSQIANIMGAPSRNVVLCKFNRLRERDPTLRHPNAPVNGKAVRIFRPNAPLLKNPDKPLPAPVVSADDLAPLRNEDGELINIFNVKSNQCEYPYGDPGQSDFHYCGHPVKSGSHYCDPHHARCYVANSAKVKISHRGYKRN